MRSDHCAVTDFSFAECWEVDSFAVAAALPVGADEHFAEIGEAFGGVGVAAGDHDDVAAVKFRDGLAVVGIPREEGFRAHVVIDERATEPGAGAVGEGAVEGVAVEVDDGSFRDFDGDGVGVFPREVVALVGAVEVGVVVGIHGPQDAWSVGAGNDPEAAVVDGRVVEGNPGAGERTVAGGNKILVLMPGLAGLAGAFDEEHRLHGFDVGTDDFGQDVDDSGVREGALHEVGSFVREMNAEDLGQNVLIAETNKLRWVRGIFAERSTVAAADRDRLSEEFVDLVGGEGGVVHVVSVFGVEGCGVLLGGVGRLSRRHAETVIEVAEIDNDPNAHNFV